MILRRLKKKTVEEGDGFTVTVTVAESNNSVLPIVCCFGFFYFKNTG